MDKKISDEGMLLPETRNSQPVTRNSQLAEVDWKL